MPTTLPKPMTWFRIPGRGLMVMEFNVKLEHLPSLTTVRHMCRGYDDGEVSEPPVTASPSRSDVYSPVL